MFCQHCNKELNSKNAKVQHEIRCSNNPDRISTGYKWSDKQKLDWAKKCAETKCNNQNWSKQRRKKASDNQTKFNKEYWTEEKRAEQSARMRQAVLENPASYTKNNVSGRVQTFEVMSSTGPTKVKGKWELKVANWLNENGVNWANNIQPYNYFWNTKWHLYFPDFLLIDDNVLIEVKGYETDRDLEKWKSVTDKKLVVLKKQQIDNLTQSMEDMI